MERCRTGRFQTSWSVLLLNSEDRPGGSNSRRSARVLCAGLRSSRRVGLRASFLVVIDAILRIPVAYPTTAFVGTHEQETFADSNFALSDCFCGHRWC